MLGTTLTVIIRWGDYKGELWLTTFAMSLNSEKSHWKTQTARIMSSFNPYYPWARRMEYIQGDPRFFSSSQHCHHNHGTHHLNRQIQTPSPTSTSSQSSTPGSNTPSRCAAHSIPARDINGLSLNPPPGTLDTENWADGTSTPTQPTQRQTKTSGKKPRTVEESWTELKKKIDAREMIYCFDLEKYGRDVLIIALRYVADLCVVEGMKATMTSPNGGSIYTEPVWGLMPFAQISPQHAARSKIQTDQFAIMTQAAWGHYNANLKAYFGPPMLGVPAGSIRKLFPELESVESDHLRTSVEKGVREIHRLRQSHTQ